MDTPFHLPLLQLRGGQCNGEQLCITVEQMFIFSLPPSPSSSVLSTQAAKQYSHRERDMVVRNSELSFHVRRLEERVGSLEKIRKDLVSLQFASQHHGPHFTLSSSFLLLLSSSQQEKLETAESQRRPLKEHNVKLSQRINDLNSALRSQEKRVKQLAQENLVLVCAVQTLYTHLVLACTIFCFTTFPLPPIHLPVLPEISQTAIGGGACSTAQEPQSTTQQGLTLSH